MDMFQQKRQDTTDALKFKSLSGTEAQKLFREDRATYDRLRAAAQSVGNLAAPAYAVQSDLPKQPGTRSWSVQEIRARAAFSEAECVKYYRDGREGSEDNVANLAEKNHSRYELLRAAAISYGVIADSHTAVKPSPLLQPKPEPLTLALGDRLAKAVNLPSDAKLTPEQIESVISLVAEQQSAANEKK